MHGLRVRGHVEGLGFLILGLWILGIQALDNCWMHFRVLGFSISYMVYFARWGWALCKSELHAATSTALNLEDEMNPIKGLGV